MPDSLQLVLSGLGGVGKTQLAVAIAERAWEQREIDLLVWITASSREAILAGYTQAAAEVLGVDATDQEQAVGRLRAWLAATERRWLVVLDNLIEPEDLRGLWPPLANKGRTVVTTWSRDGGLAGADRKQIDIGIFTPEQSVTYLTRRLAARPSLADDPAALADALGHLPLALAQAAAYLLDQEVSCTAYRALLADPSLRLDDLRPGVLPDDHERAVAATWSLSAKLADRAPHPRLAKRLLHLASVLDPNGIPGAVLDAPTVISWLTAKRLVDGGYPDRLGAQLHKSIWVNSRADHATTPSQRRQAQFSRWVERWIIRKFAGELVSEASVTATTRRLHLLSLAAHDPASDARTLRVHALVQRATREELSSTELARVARLAADALIEAWPTAKQTPEVGLAFFANARALTETAPDALWDGVHGPHPIIMVAGDFLLSVGHGHGAVDYLTWLVAELRSRFDPDAAHVLSARQRLSAALGRAGDQAGAVVEIEAVYADALRTFGPGWHEIFGIRSNLAIAWYKAGLITQAAEEFERLAADCVARLGRYNQMTLFALHQLAHIRGEVGDAAAAVAAYEVLLEDSRRLPRLMAKQFELYVRVQLAHWHGESGDAAAAITELEALIKQQTPLLGPNNRRILAMRLSLGHWQGEAGDAAGAVAAHEALLADWLMVQAPDHPDAMMARQYLAHWRGKAGDPKGAAAELEELLADRLRVLSTDHPDTLATRTELARWQADVEGDEVSADAK